MEEISWTENARNLALSVKSRGISYMNSTNGRLTGLVTYCVETAFCNRLLNER
jgi:hypothetical protein